MFKSVTSSCVRFITTKYLARKNSFRTFWYGHLFDTFGNGSRINGKISVLVPEQITIGANVSINDGCFLNARAPIVIGDHVHLSPNVSINTGGLGYANFMEERQHVKNPVKIADGVWVGTGAIINPGVTIKKNSVVGAGAVVTKDVPENVVVVGVPARILKTIL